MRSSSFYLLLLAALTTTVQSENIDAGGIERFCYPDVHQSTRKPCDCSNENTPPFGLRSIQIDCSFLDFKTNEISAVLPLYVNVLDLSWNALDKVPPFSSDSLSQLNLMHNNISVLVAKNFVGVSNLHELYLNWNSIQAIELKAFENLAHLRVLDLSHNNVHALNFQIFAPLMVLDSLDLSWNRRLNSTEGLQELDFYKTFGVNMKLHSLKVGACSLSNLVLPGDVSLEELDLRRNSFTQLPQHLPRFLRKVDVSENLFESLSPADTKLLPHVKELLVEDMPRMHTVEENAFVPFKSLHKASFQNSRRLETFHAYAFGANASNSALRTLNLRGTGLRSLNSTLALPFRQLTELDLNGMPLRCDCELLWIKQLLVETNGRCFKPSRLRGMRITDASVSDFSCEVWPRWVYRVIILVLILITSAGIYFIVIGLRRNRGVTLRRKVGVGSPYARVTIEPNRQNSNHY